jgi:hypothetical protein
MAEVPGLQALDLLDGEEPAQRVAVVEVGHVASMRGQSILFI